MATWKVVPKRLFFTLALIVISSAEVATQSTTPDSGGCSNAFAKLVVDQQVEQSKTVAETDKRVRILVRSADFMWRFDEGTARDYYAEAYKVATDRFNEKGFEKKKDKDLVIRTPDFRFEVITAIARKDPEWAKRLIEQLLKEYEKAASERDEHDKNNEIGSMLQIAEASVKTNPRLSWHLFRRAMQAPLDYYWYFALFSVARQDRLFADQLYEELLRNYASETPRRFLLLSAYPYAAARIFGIEKYSYGASIPDTLAPNARLQQRFIATFLQNALAYASNPDSLNRQASAPYKPEPVYILAALQEIEPIIIEGFPSMLHQLAEARARAGSLLDHAARKELADEAKRVDNLGASFDERLKEVETADEEGRLTDFMIVQLLVWDASQKSEGQFKKILAWIDKIKDEDVRSGTTNYYWFLRSKLAIKESRIDDAQKFAAKVPELDHRALLHFEIAEEQLKNVNESSGASQILDEVGKIARQAGNSPAKARVLLGLAAAYEKVNHVFALDELSDAVKVINKLENFDVFSSSVRRQIRGKNFSFYAAFDLPGYDLESTFKLVSKNDFELSLANAKALEDKYLRTIAVIAIAQTCVDKQKPKVRAR